MLNGHELAIGFIPNPQSEKDVTVIVEKVMVLFHRRHISQVCLVRGYICQQILVDAGFPLDKITVLPCSRKDDPVEALMMHLKSFPEILLLISVIAISYACPRYAAKLRRAERAEEAKNAELAPKMIVVGCEVFSDKIDFWYPFHLLGECLRIGKDLLHSSIWQTSK